jgi:hypothetical protein
MLTGFQNHSCFHVVSALCLAFAAAMFVACGDVGSGVDAEVLADVSVVETSLGPDVGEVDTGDVEIGSSQACTGLEDGTPCEDGNVCTTDDACTSGVCSGGVNVICEEAGACSEGSCEPTTGCVYTPLEDGSLCTASCFGAASCQSGDCVVDPGSATVCPTPEAPCVDQLGCDSETGECTVEITLPVGTNCDTDEDLCSVESCDDAGQCVAAGEIETCEGQNADNPCWTYTCNAKSGCVQTNFVQGVSCNDNNPCTYTDICTLNEFGQESCLGEAIPTDDSNPCTDDACVDGTVTHTPVDGVPCTADDSCSSSGTCEAGQCVTGSDCGCEADADCAQPDDLCAGTQVCDAGTCVVDESTVVTCPLSTDACNVNGCDPATGTCVATPEDDGIPCTPSGSPCSDTGTCQAGACTPDALCDCSVDGDCAPPEDLCTGATICNASGACELDTTQAVVCPAGATPCEGSVCAPETGVCNPVSFGNGTACTPLETACSETGTCQMGSCQPDEACPTQEALFLLDGLEAALMRTVDQGESWEFVSELPFQGPVIPSLVRAGSATLYVTTYINTDNAATVASNLGVTVDPGVHMFRSEDAGLSWSYAAGWDAGSPSHAICAQRGGDSTSVLALDSTGAIHLSYGAAEMGFQLQGSWGNKGSMLSCAWSLTGVALFADTAYCIEPAEDGCAAVWSSTDMGATTAMVGNYTPAGSGNRSVITASPDGSFMALGDDTQLYRSVDDGVSWSFVADIPANKSVGDITFGDDGRLYAATVTGGCGGDDCSPENAGEFYVSIDNGNSWTAGVNWTPGGNGSGWISLTTGHVEVTP